MTDDPSLFVERDADGVERERLFDRLNRMEAEGRFPFPAPEDEESHEEARKILARLRELRGLSFDERVAEKPPEGRKGLLRRRAKPSGGKAKA